MQQSTGLSRGPRRSGPHRRKAWTARAADRDLRMHDVILIAVVMAGLTAWLEIATTGRLGWFFDVMFVLVSVTNALAAARHVVYAPLITPPAVLLTVIVVVAAVEPTAVDEPGTPPDASIIQLAVVGLVHHALALVIGFGAALGITGWRYRSEPTG